MTLTITLLRLLSIRVWDFISFHNAVTQILVLFHSPFCFIQAIKFIIYITTSKIKTFDNLQLGKEYYFY